MFSIDYDNSSKEIVNKIYNYMLDKGMDFVKYNETDSSPYARLRSGTSIGFRKRSKWNKKGIVFFCAKDEVDKNALCVKLNISAYDNRDKDRPYALFIPVDKFEKAVEILCTNQENMKLFTSDKLLS